MKSVTPVSYHTLIQTNETSVISSLQQPKIGKKIQYRNKNM